MMMMTTKKIDTTARAITKNKSQLTPSVSTA